MKLNKRALVEARGFFETFELYPVSDEWRDELYNYFICGFKAGSFHSALFANDLTTAAFRSHPSNQWRSIQEFVKWNFANAPACAVGSHENVKAWVALSEKKRRKICEGRGWLLTEKELAWKLLEQA